MENHLSLIHKKIRKYLTSSLLFTCQNCLVYKFEDSVVFYDHKDKSNETFSLIVDILSNLTEIFKYDDNQKADIVLKLSNEKFEYSKIIFDYYISYFNLEFINKLYISTKYVDQLEDSLKTKIHGINNHIKINSTNIFTDYMPYLLKEVNENEFNKIATTISHEYERFTFEHIKNIYNYYLLYFSETKLKELTNSTLEDKFSFSTILDKNTIINPESSEKLETLIEDIQREVMNAISDLTLLYESIKDLNVLIGFIVDEAVLFENQLIIKDIYYTFKEVIKDDESLLVNNLFETLDNAIFEIVETSYDFTEQISKLDKNNPNTKNIESLLNVLDILETVYSDDAFDYFVSDVFFTQYVNN